MQPVSSSRAGPGSGTALSQASNIRRKKGRSDRRKEEKHVPGALPEAASPTPARLPSKGRKRWFHVHPSWPGPGH